MIQALLRSICLYESSYLIVQPCTFVDFGVDIVLKVGPLFVLTPAKSIKTQDWGVPIVGIMCGPLMHGLNTFTLVTPVFFCLWK